MKVDLDEEEVAKVQFLVRSELRKMDRGKPKMAQKFGEAVDFDRVNRKQRVLESVYRKLGGDPDNISNRAEG